MPDPRPASLDAIWREVQACRRCGLWRNATQGVAGDGDPQARLMLVGEQPGDAEDLQGRPFVGPAGRLLDQALDEAGVQRDGVYVTNAVKHFKHELRGKRRLHKKPDTGEVTACRWWLDAERELVVPRVILAMGATAAHAVLGKAQPVMKARGLSFPLGGGGQGRVTVHPSYLLRIPDAAAKAKQFELFVEDLKAADALAAKLARAG